MQKKIRFLPAIRSNVGGDHAERSHLTVLFGETIGSSGHHGSVLYASIMYLALIYLEGCDGRVQQAHP